MTTATDRTDTAKPARPDKDEIIRSLNLICGENCTEIRLLDVAIGSSSFLNTFSGYYDAGHFEKAADDVMKLAGSAVGCYFIFNPITPDLLARRANRLAKAPKDATTSDKDVLSRKWFLIDADANRLAGICSTEDEHQAALDRIYEVRDWLSGRGFPLPMVGDSSNGGHALYSINLPADDGGLIKQFLRTLDAKFTDGKVKIDTAVYNPARITKLYGTVGRKGDHVPNRPHRLSYIIDALEDVQQVPRALLEAIAAEAPAEQKASSNGKGHYQHNEHSDTGYNSADWTVEEKVRRATPYLEKMDPGVASQNGSCRTFAAACMMVRGFDLPREVALDLLHMVHNPICSPAWSDRELEHKVDDAIAKADGQPGYKLGAKQKRRGSRSKQSAPPPQSESAPEAEQPEDLPLPSATVGTVQLLVHTVKESPSGKLTILGHVERGNEPIDVFSITDAASGRDRAAELVQLHAGADVDLATVNAVLGKLLIDGRKYRDNEKKGGGEPKGPAIAEIVGQLVPQNLRCTFKTPKGLYSESLGRIISRADFTKIVSSDLMEECTLARDFPGERPKLLTAIKAELEVLFNDLADELPLESDSDAKPDDAARDKFWAAMVELWTAPRTFEVSRTSQTNTEIAARASLISRVRSSARAYLGPHPAKPDRRDSKWQQVQTAFSAWWRPYIDQTDAVQIALAMRYELTRQIGVELPNVDSTASLGKLADKYSRTTSFLSLSAKTSDGRKRLTILPPDFTIELLEDPTEFEME